MPPPMTSRLSGRSSSSAPVESMMRGSSGSPGRRTGSDPTAMTHWAKLTRRADPSAVTSSSWGEVNFASPRITVTLRWRASASSPFVRRATTESFHSRSLVRRSRARRSGCHARPWRARPRSRVAACRSALDGMQPTFRHTPPSVGPRSTSATLSPRSAARNAAVYPPGPAPSTTRSNSRAGRPEAACRGVSVADSPDGDVGTGTGCRRQGPDRHGIEVRLAAIRLPRAQRGVRDGLVAVSLSPGRRAPGQHRDRGAGRDLVSRREQHPVDHAGARRGHVHGGLVAFERDERRLRLHAVARLHQHLEHGDALGAAEVGDAQHGSRIGRCTHAAALRIPGAVTGWPAAVRARRPAQRRGSS
jgi:hypothetical protein